MKTTILLSVLFLSIQIAWGSKDVPLWITVDQDALNFIKNFSSFEGEDFRAHEGDGIVAVKVNEGMLNHLSMYFHKEKLRCGGFFIHESEEEAIEKIYPNFEDQFISTKLDYSINQNKKVEKVMGSIKESEISGTIKKLSSFQNRYYQSQTGVDAVNWIASKWESIVEGRNDASVEKIQHSFLQNSIILTIEGQSEPEKIVVIGGHADSIAGWFGSQYARAPGADDNASGIATITEVMRSLVLNGYKPEKTIKFMAYAGEEKGLLGSKDIANSFKRQGREVVGVMQLDMVNFKGSSHQDIVLMTDHTNADQNKFIGRLIDEYVKVPWGFDKCGYGCSDHASWNAAGYPASIPFEARKNSMNRNIHTERDTISISGNNAEHAVKFAKLASAYLIELAK